MITTPESEVAYRLTVTGVVQGVGFRPFVHRLARRHGLVGEVTNVAGEVEIVVQGGGRQLDGFVVALVREAPALARIDDVRVATTRPVARAGFTIAASRDPGGRRQPVPPDAAICEACEAELFASDNRRFHHPFITCTECGPRATVIEAMPYDRERTSMSGFPMCESCLAEYREVGNRRHHSETNCCPRCGPTLWYESPDGSRTVGHPDVVIAVAAAVIAAGGIVAVRGVGGFQVAADATSARAVDRLRRAKHRETKPFAVMVRGLSAARRLVEVGRAEAALICSSARPVVLLPARDDGPLAAGVAPGLDTIGVMLPATPLHHLLLQAVDRPLLMTSGNATDEPIAIGNDEARERLGALVDGMLLHDREIVARYDDSVVRPVAGRPIMVRRARGYAPLPIALAQAAPVPLVAVGGDLKNTFALVEGQRAYLSPHIGDLEEFATQQHFLETLDRFRRLFQIDPEVVVRDLHPGYHSTRLAGELGIARVVAVQHHHAHVAAVLAEHGMLEPVIGVAFDGTGYGDDGTVWGGELLLADLAGYRRLGNLRPAPLPGGDLAARQPWRTALGYLSLEPDAAPAFEAAFRGVDPTERELAGLQVRRAINAPLASSMGRLFDAASAVLGLRRVSGHEGQAAMELESLAQGCTGRALPMPIVEAPGAPWILDPLPLLSSLGTALGTGRGVAQLAADFHESVVVATERLVGMACDSTGIDTVVLSGGVFQNARLMTQLPERLAARGLTVLLPRRLSPNDGALSFGQAAVAGAFLSRGTPPTTGGA